MLLCMLTIQPSVTPLIRNHGMIMTETMLELNAIVIAEHLMNWLRIYTYVTKELG